MSTEWLYENNDDNSCRYVLGVVGQNPLICVGVNPSTAEPNRLDNTVRSVSRIAIQNGYDSWIMLNLYPQRATNPNEMDMVAKSELVTSNFSHIKKFLEQHSGADIWAAWGTLIEKRNYLLDCLIHLNTIVSDCKCKWISIGRLSKNGHPHHPLYLKSTTPKETFNIKSYHLKLQQKKTN